MLDRFAPLGNITTKAGTGAAWIEMPPKDADAPCNLKFYMHFDDEDNGNSNEFYIWAFNNAWENKTGKSGFMGGIAHPFGESGRNGANSTFTMCQEYVSYLPIARYDYAVMAGSSSCPLNGYKFTRHFDNEDNHNTNRTDNSGLAAPNWAEQFHSGFSDEGLAEFNFCFVPGDGNANTAAFPQMTFGDGTSFETHYMVFSNAPYTWRGKIKSDDEDSGNSNSWVSSDTTDASLIQRMKAIVGDAVDTWIYFGAEGTRPQTSFYVGSQCPSKPTPPTCQTCSVDWANYSRALDEWKTCTGG